MKENAIKKINTMGKVGGILTLIAKIFTGLGIGLCLVGMIVLLVIPKDFITFNVEGGTNISVDMGAIGQSISDEDAKKIEEQLNSENTSGSVNINGETMELVSGTVDGDVINVKASGTSSEFSINRFAWATFAGTLSLACAMVTLVFIGKLCKSFKVCESPFEEGVIKSMKHLAFSLIPWTVISSISESITNSMLSSKLSFNISLDLTVVVAIIIIFGLVYVFQYGAMLQQESDETL